jgi:hypothetical protein
VSTNAPKGLPHAEEIIDRAVHLDRLPPQRLGKRPKLCRRADGRLDSRVFGDPNLLLNRSPSSTFGALDRKELPYGAFVAILPESH